MRLKNNKLQKERIRMEAELDVLRMLVGVPVIDIALTECTQ